MPIPGHCYYLIILFLFGVLFLVFYLPFFASAVYKHKINDSCPKSLFKIKNMAKQNMFFFFRSSSWDRMQEINKRTYCFYFVKHYERIKNDWYVVILCIKWHTWWRTATNKSLSLYVLCNANHFIYTKIRKKIWGIFKIWDKPNKVTCIKDKPPKLISSVKFILILIYFILFQFVLTLNAIPFLIK